MNTKLLLTLAILSAGNAPKIQASATVLCGSAQPMKNASGDFGKIAHLLVGPTSDGQMCVVRYNSLPQCTSTSNVMSACKVSSAVRVAGSSEPYLNYSANIVLPAAPFKIIQGPGTYTAAQVIAAFQTNTIPATGVRAAAVATPGNVVSGYASQLGAMGPLP